MCSGEDNRGDTGIILQSIVLCTLLDPTREVLLRMQVEATLLYICTNVSILHTEHPKVDE